MGRTPATRLGLVLGVLVFLCVRSGASAHEPPADWCSEPPHHDDCDHDDGDDDDHQEGEHEDDDARSCDDGDPCTTDACRDGQCKHDAIPGCSRCSEASGCDDGDSCTTDTCSDGTCRHAEIEVCERCEVDADCDDHDRCTGESCTAGACKRYPIGDCQPCATAADCDDGSACTGDSCADGICQHATIEGCTPCGSDADCQEGDGCTVYRCNAGACTHEKDPQCPTPAEVCGDCIDNDGDGLVDYEDPDCCEQMHTLAVRRMRVRGPGGRSHGKRLRLKAVYADAMPRGFDPQHHDTSIQISDRRGHLLCKTIAASHWMKRRHGFKFWDMNRSFAGGLSDGRFTIKPSGRVLFRTQGKKVDLRPVEGSVLRVAVRVGGRCTASSMALHQRNNALVFP